MSCSRSATESGRGGAPASTAMALKLASSAHSSVMSVRSMSGRPFLPTRPRREPTESAIESTSPMLTWPRFGLGFGFGFGLGLGLGLGLELGPCSPAGSA